MGIFSKLFGGTSSATVYNRIVIDGASLAGASRTESASPKNQLVFLRRIGRYSQQENVPSKVVFPTEPLRKVGDKQEFEGTTVCFTNGEDGYQKRVLSEAGGGALLITSDAALELAAEGRGIRVMRGSTFSKALEGSPSRGGRQDRGDRSERGPGQNRNRNRNRTRSRSRNGAEGSQPRRQEPEGPTGVEALIDMVD